MNGIHDMGGRHGFGPVVVEPDEPVFHERWEARVFAMTMLATLHLDPNIDAGRHAIETLPPLDYLALGYYGRWCATLEARLEAAGVLAAGEVDARVAGRDVPAPGRWTAPVPPPGYTGFIRTLERPPAFAVGDAVVTRNHQPAGHTRLPAYVRCRRGAIARVYPACVFPDTHAHGRGEHPQPVYNVRFEGRELWGDTAEPGTCVHIDLFEAYLEPVETR